MKIFTTINPNCNFESQSKATTSWSNKYQVYSINTEEEINKIKDLYPHINFIETKDTFSFGKKKLIKLNSILSSISENCDSETVAIVNSDIILNNNLSLNINERYLLNGIFIGTRYEIDGNKKYPFIYGYDLFIFDSNYAEFFKNENYVIGMPWWDYWIPIFCIKNGINLYHLKDEIIYHKTHDTNYDMNTWLEFGKKFHKDIAIDTLNENISLEDFIKGNLNEPMDIKKFIEYKQINLSII